MGGTLARRWRACTSERGRSKGSRIALVVFLLVTSVGVLGVNRPAHASLPEPVSQAFLDGTVGALTNREIWFPTVTYSPSPTGYANFTISNGTDRYEVDFAAPVGQPLVSGTYEDAQTGGTASDPGLSVTGDGSGCTDEGRFVVDDATYDGSGNLLSSRPDLSNTATERPAPFLVSSRMTPLQILLAEPYLPMRWTLRSIQRRR